MLICVTLYTGSFHEVDVPIASLQQQAKAEQVAETDIHAEYARQREHMESTVASLRKKLTKDAEIHRSQKTRMMQVLYTVMYHVLHSGKFLLDVKFPQIQPSLI